MRDLVETVIGQVMKQKPTMKAVPSTNDLDAFKATRLEQAVEVKDQKLWGACCQFEAVFLQQMMSAMRKTIPESESSPHSYANSMYEGMMDQAISESGSKKAPLGLALNMYRQLQRDGQEVGAGAPSIQDIQQAADTIKNTSSVNKPNLGGM